MNVSSIWSSLEAYSLISLTVTGVSLVSHINYVFCSRYICCDGQDVQMEWMISIFMAQVLIWSKNIIFSAVMKILLNMYVIYIYKVQCQSFWNTSCKKKIPKDMSQSMKTRSALRVSENIRFWPYLPTPPCCVVEKLGKEGQLFPLQKSLL